LTDYIGTRLHQAHFPKLWFIFSIFLLSLYSVYYYSVGSALFQVIGMVLFTRILFISPYGNKLSVKGDLGDVLLLILLGIVVLASSLWGTMFFGSIQLKGPISFLLGLFVLCIVLINEKHKEVIYECLQIVIIIQLAFWLIQFFSYWLFGFFIDYLAMVSDMTTRYYGLGIVHFCGFFQEPSTYACFMIMGLSVRLIKNKFQLKIFDAVIITSVLLSLSILGFFCLLVLFVVCFLAAKSKVKRKMTIYTIIMIILMIILSNVNILNWNYIVSRAKSPLSDPSGYARMIVGLEYVKKYSEVMQIFGKGYGNYSMRAISANTVAYLLEYLGFLGAIATLAIFTILLIKRRTTLWVWVFLGLSLLWPIYLSTLYWWFWVGLMLNFGKGFRTNIN